VRFLTSVPLKSATSKPFDAITGSEWSKGFELHLAWPSIQFPECESCRSPSPRVGLSVSSRQDGKIGHHYKTTYPSRGPTKIFLWTGVIPGPYLGRTTVYARNLEGREPRCVNRVKSHSPDNRYVIVLRSPRRSLETGPPEPPREKALHCSADVSRRSPFSGPVSNRKIANWRAFRGVL
jgi:hypothetical protein